MANLLEELLGDEVERLEALLGATQRHGPFARGNQRRGEPIGIARGQASPYEQLREA